jgi:hypothetical protein
MSRSMSEAEPTIRSLHLGAGRQSTTIALLVAHGLLPKPDYALFSDTGSEPGRVYTHLERIEREVLGPAGVPLRLVSHGNLADDVLSAHVFATIPAYTLELVPQQRGFLSWSERAEGRQPRHCTGRYKIEPLQREERILLGARVREVPCKYCDATGVRLAPWNAKLLEAEDLDLAEVLEPEDWMRPGPCSVCRGSRVRTLVDEAPKDKAVEIWVGYDANEAVLRINDKMYAPYQRAMYPLLDLPRPAERIAEDRRRMRRHSEVGWTLADCLWYLHQHGWTDVPKSACYMCPNASNARWRDLRDNDPEAWQKAVAYDKALRNAPGMRGQRFLHEDRVPLDEANIDRLTASEITAQQGDIFDALAEIDWGGCSPHGCSTEPASTAGAPR